MKFFLLLLFSSYTSLLTAQIIKPAPFEASSPREELRKRIFATKLTQRACEVLAKDPNAEHLGKIDEDLNKTVKSIIEAVRSTDEKKLRDTFNPRLKVKAVQVLSSLQVLKKITGDHLSVSNYRIAALNSIDGSGAPIECEDTGVLMHPLYGYPLSVGVWLQATGDEEVARILMSLVPDAKTWTIGAWHIQQWTHASKDFAMWYDLAQAEAQKGHKAGAFIASDIAAKLLDGGGFLDFPVKADAETFRDKQMTRDVWVQTIKDTFPGDHVVHAATLFAKDGAGVLVRFQIAEEKSANAIKDHCISRLTAALKAEWTSPISGIRCSYIFPKEDASKEGVVGGMFIGKEDLKPKS